MRHELPFWEATAADKTNIPLGSSGCYNRRWEIQFFSLHFLLGGFKHQFEGLKMMFLFFPPFPVICEHMANPDESYTILPGISCWKQAFASFPEGNYPYVRVIKVGERCHFLGIHITWHFWCDPFQPISATKILPNVGSTIIASTVQSWESSH